MSLVEELRVARKARLERMGAPPRAPVVAIPRPPIPPQAFNAGWEGMWFFDLLPVERHPEDAVPVKKIQEAVCKHYGTCILDLTSDRRDRFATYTRHVGMYLARTLTSHSYAEIGRRFGGRDHSTALHGSRRIERLLASDPKVINDVTTLRRMLA